MAATGYTPISLYYSSTASAAPSAGSLVDGELAINITDGKLFYKDNSAAVQVIGWKTTPATAGGTGQTTYATGDLLYASATNTLSNIGNSSLTNSSVTINGSTVALGGSTTVTATAGSALTIGTGLSGTSYNGSAPVTIAVDSTVATLTGAQTLINKTIVAANNTITTAASGTLAATELNAALAELASEKVQKSSNTGSAMLPSGTTAQRDGSPAAGYLRFNATLNQFEGYNGTAWVNVVDVSTAVTLTGTQTLTNKTLTTPTLSSPLINLGINSQTGTSYTPVLADNGKLVTLNNASAITVSIPTNASVAYPTGSQISFAWITGAGQPTIQAASSGTTTILSTGGTSTAPKLRVANSTATCVKLSTDTWIVMGDIS